MQHLNRVSSKSIYSDYKSELLNFQNKFSLFMTMLDQHFILYFNNDNFDFILEKVIISWPFIKLNSACWSVLILHFDICRLTIQLRNLDLIMVY